MEDESKKETTDIVVTRKRAAMAVLFIALLMVALLAASFYQGTAYERNLAEEMSINRDGSPVGASVYWYVNGEFVYAEHNLMCNLGLNDTAHHIGDQTWVNSNATTNAFRWIAIGTGTGQGAGDNALATEFARASGAFTPIASVNGNWTIDYTWNAGSFSGQTITEAGCFNDGTTGTMLNYQSFTGIPLQATDSLQVEFMFQIS